LMAAVVVDAQTREEAEESAKAVLATARCEATVTGTKLVHPGD